MKRYLKAEFTLCKKNVANFIIGGCGLFLYCFLLLFSGVGGVWYAATISIIGFVVVLFFVMPWFLSPVSYFENRRKLCVSSEKIALILGESKRTFVKIRIFICVTVIFLMIGVTAVMQLPAWLIAGEQYSVSLFIIEVVGGTGFSLLAMVILFLSPGEKLPLWIPVWSGACGGVAGGFLGDVQEISEVIDIVRMYSGLAVIGFILFSAAVLFRYIKTVREERRR